MRPNRSFRSCRCWWRGSLLYQYNIFHHKCRLKCWIDFILLVWRSSFMIRKLIWHIFRFCGELNRLRWLCRILNKWIGIIRISWLLWKLYMSWIIWFLPIYRRITCDRVDWKLFHQLSKEQPFECFHTNELQDRNQLRMEQMQFGIGNNEYQHQLYIELYWPIFNQIFRNDR